MRDNILPSRLSENGSHHVIIILSECQLGKLIFSHHYNITISENRLDKIIYLNMTTSSVWEVDLASYCFSPSRQKTFRKLTWYDVISHHDDITLIWSWLNTCNLSTCQHKLSRHLGFGKLFILPWRRRIFSKSTWQVNVSHHDAIILLGSQLAEMKYLTMMPSYF